MKFQTKTCFVLFIILLFSFRSFASQLEIDDMFNTSFQDKTLVSKLINELWGNDNGVLILGRLQELMQSFESFNFRVRVTTEDEAESGRTGVLKKLSRKEDTIEFTIQMPNLNINRLCLFRRERNDNSLYLSMYSVPEDIILGHELTHILLWLEFFKSDKESFLQLIKAQEPNLGNFKGSFDHWVQEKLWPNALRQRTKTDEGLRIFEDCWEQADEFPVILGYTIADGVFAGNVVGEKQLLIAHYSEHIMHGRVFTEKILKERWLFDELNKGDFIPWSHETSFIWNKKEIKGKKTFSPNDIEAILHEVGIDTKSLPDIQMLEKKCGGSFPYVQIDQNGIIRNSVWEKEIPEWEKFRKACFLVHHFRNTMDTEEIKSKVGIESFALVHPQNGMTLLHAAVIIEDIDLLRFLIKEKLNIEAKDNDDNTPLHWAVSRNEAKVVNFLVEEAKANVNAINNRGRSPLHIAVIHNKIDLKITKILRKANINIKDNDGMTAFHWAAFLNNADIENKIVKLLINVGQKDENGVEIRTYQTDDEKITAAVEKAKNEAEELILKILQGPYKGACIETLITRGKTDFLEDHRIEIPDVSMSSYSDLPLIHRAINIGSVIKDLLLDYNPNLNEMDRHGMRAHHIVALQGNIEAFKQLNPPKSLLKSVDKNGFTCLHLAVHNGHTDFIKECLKEIIEKDEYFREAKDNAGNTAFMVAIGTQQHEAAKLLLEWGADVIVQSSNGNTVLHVALDRLLVGKGSEELVELIIKKGADVNTLNSDGNTPLYQALICLRANKCSEDLVRLMINKRANVNNPDKDIDTPLHIALALLQFGQGSEGLVKLIVDNGADVHAINKKGVTPLHMALYCLFKGKGSEELLVNLIEKGADVNDPGKIGVTPLHMALYANKERKVSEKLLELMLSKGGSS